MISLPFTDELKEPAYNLMRLLFGLLFAFHGAQKLFGAFGGNQAKNGLMWAAGAIEFFGGLAIALGFLTSLAALICSAQMLVAYFYAHFPQGWVPIQNRGELALVYLVGFFFIMTRGGGSWSLDSLMARK